MNARAAAFIVIAVLVAGCLQSGPRCSPPYMEYGMGYCCLDANQNGVCDKYERPASANASVQSVNSGISAKTSPTTMPP